MFNESVKQTQQIIRQIFEEEKKTYGLATEMYPVTVIQFYKDHIKKLISDDDSLSTKLSIIRTPQMAAGVWFPAPDTNEDTIFVFLKLRRRIKKINRRIYYISFISYHEIRHAIQNKFDKYSYEGFLNSLDKILKNFSHKDYLTEHSNYSFEIGANLYAATKTKEYLQKHYPDLYEKEKKFIEKNINKYKYYYMIYDASDTVERMIQEIKTKLKQNHESEVKGLDKASPVLPIFLNPDLSFKKISDIISNEKFKQLDKRIVYAFLSSKTFLKTINFEKLTEEELNLVHESLQYTNTLYLNQFKLLSQETNLTLIELLKVEKNILKKYSMICYYIEKKVKHTLNFRRSDIKKKKHMKSIPRYLEKTNNIIKSKGYITINIFYIIGSILSITTIIYLLIKK